ncbi:hypothetical protein GH714_013825 [Hevea brasiliensis]|uniref:Uncharacterized protein n=1 Tax=Hevea brasiliensis TaxID=3981 RepID=A0A6A6LS77_HEVBR|nr:hypothetical protein GH714_013825 [Hevea brasiliensis]
MSIVFKVVNSIRTNGVPSSSLIELTQEQMRKIEDEGENNVRRGEGGEGNGEATSDCSTQEDGRVGKVGGSSEEWGGSEAGGGTGVGGTERSKGRTREGDESGRLCKA